MPGCGGTEPLVPAAPGGSMWVWVQPGLLSEIQNSQGDTEKSCLKDNRQVRVLSCSTVPCFPTAAALGDSLHFLASTPTDDSGSSPPLAYMYLLLPLCEGDRISRWRTVKGAWTLDVAMKVVFGFFLVNFYFMYMCMYLNVCQCTMWMQEPAEVRRGIRSQVTQLSDNFDPSWEW